MKKLLSLLSVLTISGSAVPTTIAASPYQKEETIKNTDINYQQTNNLEKLNRNKRGWDDLNNASKGAIIGAGIVGGGVLIFLTGGTILMGAGLGAATGFGAISGAAGSAGGLATASGIGTVVTGTVFNGAIGAGIGAGIGSVV
ncbi:hypothetical protein [Spiroplasma endosymbiont of Sarcophaga variegata]|uniref:hypothetical protein n=1 Tax=Spiroplasma endosymbiont of Sarcophaga variegata TaxID=3066304 RepID=UPI003AF8FD7C